MTVAKLVPRKPNKELIETLEALLAAANAGEIETFGAVSLRNGEFDLRYLGGASALVYGLELLKHEILAND